MGASSGMWALLQSDTRDETKITQNVAAARGHRRGREGRIVLGRVLVEEGVRITAVVSRSRASARAAGRFSAARNASTALTAIPRGHRLSSSSRPRTRRSPTSRARSRRLEGLDFQQAGGLPRLGNAHRCGPRTVRGARGGGLLVPSAPDVSPRFCTAGTFSRARGASLRRGRGAPGRPHGTPAGVGPCRGECS